LSEGRRGERKLAGRGPERKLAGSGPEQKQAGSGHERKLAGREVELKLAGSARTLASVGRHPALLALAVGPAQRRHLRSLYYDTADLALWRSGLVLRVRADGPGRIVSVKTRGTTRAGLVAREEHERPLPGTPRDPRRVARRELLAAIGEPRLRAALVRTARGRRLAARVETRFQRTTLPLRASGARLELAIDLGVVRAGTSRLPISEVELELVAGPARALFDVALRLARDLALHPAALGKAERGFLRLLGEAPSPSRAQGVSLARYGSLEVSVRAVLGECVRHLTANAPPAARGDVEGVHQMRVAARRLRSALQLFASWLPARGRNALDAELRWLGLELGRARDLDVFALELLEPLAAREPRDAGLATLRRATRAARSDAHAAVRTALASHRYDLLALQLGRLVEAGAPPARGKRARAALRPQLRARVARVREFGARIGRLETPALHRLRIRTKRLRYALELVGPLADGPRVARLVRRLAELQDALGHLNDLANAEAQLAVLRAHVPLSAALAVTRAEGVVLSHAARSAAAGRRTLGAVWRRARLDALWRSLR
jgi:inorganic triphosphatase YgiF